MGESTQHSRRRLKAVCDDCEEIYGKKEEQNRTFKKMPHDTHQCVDSACRYNKNLPSAYDDAKRLKCPCFGCHKLRTDKASRYKAIYGGHYDGDDQNSGLLMGIY